MMRFFILPAIFVTCAVASVPVRDACNEDASIVATIQAADPIQVKHGVVGESLPCYAVSVKQAGSEVQGYVLDNTLPAILEFERVRALESRVPVPAPTPAVSGPVVTTEKKPAGPTGPPFASWTGVDVMGKRVQVPVASAKVTLVSFWSAESATARRSAENLNRTVGEFRSQGVRAVGLAQAKDKGQLEYYLDDMGLNYPQVLDRQGLAGKYHADARRGTTLVVDSSNHIVASSSDPKEIRAAILKLLSSE